MVAFINQNDTDDIVARITDIAYRALLNQGLSRPFVDVELALWRDIRAAYHATAPAGAATAEAR